ncbi:hypothetical protein FA13DRAFT_768061 [Coprinellus micaceus]|uniref:Uncharacterized protein n=1 Tax=Coprinellus micaceus TaxID=71717 RepID=A0A4Y7S8P5_COPMI|nr:hypothetical protein FA13DRAFT_768061 [Coprinellus micaceus]
MQLAFRLFQGLRQLSWGPSSPNPTVRLVDLPGHPRLGDYKAENDDRPSSKPSKRSYSALFPTVNRSLVFATDTRTVVNASQVPSKVFSSLTIASRIRTPHPTSTFANRKLDYTAPSRWEYSMVDLQSWQ